jgi:5-hydroxyisourate hydrolase-like protein (transthyretin family)
MRPSSGVTVFANETPEHHFAAVANTITPEDGRIRPKHVDSYNTCNKSYTFVHQVGYSFTLRVYMFKFGFS